MSFTDFQLLVAQARSEASNPAFKGFVGWQGKWQWRAVKWIIEEGWIEIHRLMTNNLGKSTQILVGI
ncbi:hypothetical protein FCULG_00001644 [Fusarium culmorum]|uniref:Uncharacterized protein n=1 Tax=Fusarium culmorum TaxID=5516 RepID=A0A2T4GQJ8_FUSCU|nr:hypothetical protein FCULG_00001644 [Fusarium culmorum]